MIAWIIDNNIGDIASVVGVIISVVGFALTLINVARSRRAANRAEAAAHDAERSIRLFDTVADVSRAISMLDEIKRLNRAGDWKVLIDRYGVLKKILIEIRSANPNLTEEQKKNVQGAIQHLSTIEDVIEKALEKNQPPTSISKLNKILSDQVEKLNVVLVELKTSKDL